MKVLVLSLFGILICAHSIQSANLGNRFVAETDVTLNLYTRNNSDTPQVLANGDVQNLSSSYFQLDKPLKVFVHGWTKQAAYDTVVEAFLAFGDFNVVLVDWTAGAETGEVSDVATNPPSVGVFLASFLDWLSTLGLPFSQIHIVGHSLGGHVVGFAGRNCKRGKIEYITALDPGLFYWVDSPDKINSGDGKYVEVIHTNAGISGLILPAGTADFYPNGGWTYRHPNG